MWALALPPGVAFTPAPFGMMEPPWAAQARVDASVMAERAAALQAQQVAMAGYGGATTAGGGGAGAADGTDWHACACADRDDGGADGFSTTIRSGCNGLPTIRRREYS